MTTYTAGQIEAIGGKRWTGRDGTTRVYLNNWMDLVDLNISYHKTGSVSGATLAGKPISNSSAADLRNGKVYWEAGEIHAGGSRRLVEWYMDELMAGIAEAIAKLGGDKADLTDAPAATNPVQPAITTLTVAEYAAKVGKAASTIRNWIKSGKIKATLVGRRWAIAVEVA